MYSILYFLYNYQNIKIILIKNIIIFITSFYYINYYIFILIILLILLYKILISKINNINKIVCPKKLIFSINKISS